MIAAIILSYLIGALPTAYFVGRCKGIDIFKTGSGNMGAHNVYHAIGAGCGLLVWLIDSGKGFAAIWLAGQPLFVGSVITLSLCGLAAVIGHIWSIWVWLLTGHLRGGKGVSTAGGTWILIAPAGVVAVTFSLWAVIFGLSGYVPLATLIAFAFGSAWLLVLIGQGQLTPVLIFYVIGVSGLIVSRHRENIQALLARRERRITRDLPRRTLASLGLFGLIAAFLSACTTTQPSSITPSLPVTVISGAVAALTVVLPPTWTPAPTMTPGPTATLFPTATAVSTLTDTQICQAFQVITSPAPGIKLAYDGQATFGWAGAPTDLQLTLVIALHSDPTKSPVRLEIPTPADSIVPFPMMNLPTDGVYDWALWLHRSPSVLPDAQGTPQIIVTSVPGDELCKHSGTFVRLPVQMM